MTARAIQSLDSLTSMYFALPGLPDRLAERIRAVDARFAALSSLYDTRVTAVKQAASAELERIDHLRNCSCSEDCSCADQYYRQASAIQQRQDRAIGALDDIYAPVSQRMRNTAMYTALQQVESEVPRYEQGLRGLVQAAQLYLGAGD